MSDFADEWKKARDEGRRQAEESMRITHRDGVPWHKAPIPRRWHRCWVQTSGYPNGNRVERCACGAIRGERYRSWMERNSRKPEHDVV